MSNLPNRIPGHGRHDVPLGTASWWTFADGAKPIHQRGDLYIGDLPSGEGVGIRDEGHALLVARTRMGKGTSFIIPNLIVWPGSVFVIDPKGENAMVTARWRGNGSRYVKKMRRKVYLLDPMRAVRRADDDFEDIRVGFNPLDMLHIDSDEMLDDAARIADALIVNNPQNPDPFWEDSARMLLRSLILHVATWPAHAHERNLVTVRRLLLEGYRLDSGLQEGSGLRLLFDGMSQNPALGGIVASAGRMTQEAEDRSPRTSGSIFQVAITNTNFIDSPPMRRSLSSSGFKLSELKTDPKGISVYVCLEDRFMAEHFRWLRMLTSLAIAEMERVKSDPATGYPILTVLDEFAALKRMQHIETAAAQVAGYGMKLVFVVQSLAQLKNVYGDNWETFVANCPVKLFWGNDDLFTKDYVSRMLGDMEVGRSATSSSSSQGKSSSSSFTSGRSQSYSETSGTSWNSQGGFSDSTSSSFSTSESRSSTSTSGTSESSTSGRSESVHKRPLLAPEEVGRLFGDPHTPRALGLIAGRPIYLHRRPYYEIESFEGHYEAHKFDGKVRLLNDVMWDYFKRLARKDHEAKQLKLQAEQRERDRLESVRRANEDRARLQAESAEEEARRAAVRAAQKRQETIERRIVYAVTWVVGLIAFGVVVIYIVA